MAKVRRLAALGCAAVLVVAGCSGTAKAAPSTIHAGEKEFTIDLDSTSAASGKVTFEVKNNGTVVHEFVVVKTDLAPDQLPKADDGTVEEETDGATVVDEVEDLQPGATGSLTVDLAPGKYIVLCNVPGHFAGGMQAKVTVGS